MTRTLFACLAAAALLAAGTASAALKPDSLRLALDSLLVATTKQAVANAILANPYKPPERNRDVNMGPPYTLTTEEIQAVFVGHGGVITIKFTAAVGMDSAFVRFLPKVVKGTTGEPTVQYDCVSPNVPEIATAYPGCVYDPASMKLPVAKPGDKK